MFLCGRLNVVSVKRLSVTERFDSDDRLSSDRVIDIIVVIVNKNVISRKHTFAGFIMQDCVFGIGSGRRQIRIEQSVADLFVRKLLHD